MSERSKVISRLLSSRNSREAYIGGKLKVLIPSQLRSLRMKSRIPRQEDLANEAGMKQSRISAMETPGAVNFNLETLVRLAAALKVGLQVRFVSFNEMLEWENEFSQDAFDPTPIDKDEKFIADVELGSFASKYVAEKAAEERDEFGSYQRPLTGAALELTQGQPAA